MNKTIYSLQIFRGIAASLVVLAHAQMYVKPDSFLKIFEPGTSGVTFFFILSGFIICYANFHSIGNGIDHTKFLSKRFIRIYPIYWVYTIFTLVSSYYFYVKTGAPLIGYSSFGIDDYFKSFLLFPYSKVGDQWPFIPVAWTLSYEMLFYLVFSLTIFLRPRYSLPIVAVWFGVIIAAFVGIINIKSSFATTFLFSSEIIEFFYGCFIALVLIRWPIIPGGKRTVTVLAAAGIILLLFSWSFAYCDKLISKSYGRVINFGLSYALLIFSAAANELISYPPFLRSKLGKTLLYIGDASYSIYLVHYWVLAIVFLKLSPKIHYDIILFCIMIIIAIAMGLFGYEYIEKPLLRNVKAIAFSIQKKNNPILMKSET